MEREDGDGAPAALERGEWTLRDEEARQYVEGATNAVASLVRSTLGPRGMEKQLRTWDHQGDPETVQTAAASEILDAIERGEGFNHPVAALFTDCVDSMQRGLGDGTTTAIVLAGALVERGLELIEEGVHPGTVAVGYAMAASRAGTVLDTLCREGPPDRTTLERVAETAMTADIPAETRAEYAAQVVAAVRGVASEGDWLDTDDVAVVAKTGESRALHRGVVIRRRPNPLDESTEAQSEFDRAKRVPEPIAPATVAVLDREIDFERTATSFGDGSASGVRVTPEQLADYRVGLAERRTETAARFERLGIDVLVSQPEVEDELRETFSDHGIFVIDEVKYPLSDIYRLARATGASVVSHPDEVEPETLGTAGVVREHRVGDEIWTTFAECAGGVFTVVADAGTETGATQRERLIKDAIEVTALAVTDEQLLPGAGAPAMAVAADLRIFSPTVSGREQLAISAFADALETVVSVLATNAGADPIDALAALRAAHAGDAPASVGLDADGDPIDAWDAGIAEPRRVFSQAVETARTAAEQLLTVDAVLFPGVEFEAYTPRTEHD